MEKFDELLEQLQKHLDCSVQNWFLGAGVSAESNVPLMSSLTKRVEALVQIENSDVCKQIYAGLKKDLPVGSNIEQILSHIGDFLTLAERSVSKKSQISGDTYLIEQLKEVYQALIKHISQTIRYGYRAPNLEAGTEEQVGSLANPIVEIENHRRFLKALFGIRANLERRSRISFFTVNYDTLLEDALSLEGQVMVDGFSGGSVGFWNPNEEFSWPDQNPRGACKVYKLHGSVDWYHDEENGLIRSRYGVKYLANPTQILIYPQATKYVEAQKNPFAILLDGLRKALALGTDNILTVCGYSFGDSHINTEIRAALKDSENKTTLLIFSHEMEEGLASPVADWLADSAISAKVFVATQKGLYNGNTKCEAYADGDLDWWSFRGITEFLKNGATL